MGESRFTVIKNLLLVGDAVRIPESINRLKQHFYVTIIDSPTFQESSSDYLKENDILWIHVDSTLQTISVNSLSKLEFIISTSTGLTHFPTQFLREFPNKVISLKGKEIFLSQITSTADLAITFILLAHTKLFRAIDSVKKTKAFNRLENARPRQIESTHLGLIGFGRLGRMVAERAASIGFRVGVYEIDPLKKELIPDSVTENFSSLEELVKWSQIISIHASSQPDHEPIVNDEFLSICDSSKSLVNTARGNLVNEKSIIKAIKKGNLSLYLTDVLADEDTFGTVGKSELLAFSLQDSRVLITPHIGGASLDAIFLCENILIDELISKIEDLT